MIRIILTVCVIVAPAVLVALAALRAMCLFSSVRRLFDGGEHAVRSVMDRAALSASSRSVTMIVDLDDVDADTSSVEIVQRYLGQRYRSLEVLVLCGDRGVPTELGLAFDITETGTDGAVTVHRSRRDDRLVCIVVSGDGGVEAAAARTLASIEASSGELVVPIDPRWELRPTALGELAAPWLRRPRTAAAFGVMHPTTSGRLGTTSLVSTRADLMATAGLGGGETAQAALGGLAAGNEGCIVGLFRRSALLQIGGLPGPIADPSTWTRVGLALHADGEGRAVRHRIHILSRPIGSVASEGQASAMARSSSVLSSWQVRLVRSGLAAVDQLRVLTGFSCVAAVLGLLTNTVSSQVVWIAAAAPVLSVAVIVLSLMMDDRALRPVGKSRARLSLLVGAVGAGLWGTVGSPLRWAPRKLD